MKQVLKKLLSALLCAAMLLSTLGAAAEMQPSTNDALGGSHMEYTGTAVTGAKGELTGDAYMRSQPSTSTGKVLATIPSGTQVEVNAIPEDRVTGWYRVRYEGKSGYVYASLLTLLDAGAKDPDYGTDVTGAKGVVTADGVSFCVGPGKNETVLSKLDEGVEVEILTVPDKISVDDWYRVRYDGKIGYIQSNFLRVTNKGDLEGPIAIGMGVTVNTNGVNFRTGPGTGYTSMGKLVSGIEVELLSIPEAVGTKYWYHVRYNGDTGYIQSPYIEVVSRFDPEDEEDQDDKLPAIAMGVIVNTNGVNFRKGPGTGYDSMGKLTSGLQVELLSIPEDVGTSYWYQVRYNGETGYIQSPYVKVLDQTPPSSPDEPNRVVSTGMVTSTSGVNFRTGPSTEHPTMGKLPEGTVVELLYIPEEIGENYWYRVSYNGKTGYIQSTFIRVLTINEDDLPEDTKYGYAKLITDSVSLRSTPGGDSVTTWKGLGSLMRITGDSVTKGVYSWVPVYHTERASILYVREDMIEFVIVKDGQIVPKPTDPESDYGYVITTLAGVNLRLTAGGDNPFAEIPRNTILPCIGPAERPQGSSYTWYKVRFEGMAGYVRGDCVRVCNASGGPVDGETNPDPDDPGSVTVYGYIKLNTGRNVRLREEPQGSTLVSLPDGMILPVVGEATPYGMYGKYIWYPVRTADGLKGYIRGDCVMLCDAQGNPLDPDPEEKPEETPDLVGVKGKILKSANFRDDASTTDGEILTVIPANTLVTVLQIPEDTEDGWYKIRYDGEDGYVHASLIEVVKDDGTGEEDPVSLGYIQITGNKVHVRLTAGGTSKTQVDTYTVWPIIGPSVMKGEVEWFNVRVGEIRGYVHGGYAYKLSAEQEEDYLNGVAPNPDEPDEAAPSGYLITTSNKLNVRESYSQDSASVTTVGKNTVLRYFDTKQVGTVTWYCVLVQDRERWVHGNYIIEMSQADYDAWVAANPDKQPNDNANLGYLRTNQNNVYIRNAADGSLYIVKINAKGTVMRYYSDAISAGGTLWYKVLTPKDGYGYVRYDLITKCQADGSDLPVPEPELGSTSSAPQSQQETSYSTLKQGSTGTKVTNLVNELINQGYYKGEPTSSFTSAVKAAVAAFQSVKGLTSNGIANSATQHALFGTRPIGAGDTDNLEFAIYPVEKIDWFTGGIQDMLPKGANFKIYDVKTGIVWWAHRWSGGRHADIETLTKADSDRLCKIYGVSSLAEIVKENMWERRPCLVTIGTRTFACSLDGMQHNPAGDTIANNGMDGQICLHFTNSEGHASQAVSESHTKAIEYAYNHCPAGQKK